MTVSEFTNRIVRNTTLLLVAFAEISFVYADDVERKIENGLVFNSFMVEKDYRTGLNLTPDKPFSLSDGFTLTFDLKIRQEVDVFGYILRIIGNGTTNIDLISNFTYNNMVLVMGDKTLLDFKTKELDVNPVGTWIKAELKVDADNNKLEFAVNGLRKSADYNVDDLNKFNIYFGVNNTIDFAVTDVAPLVVKNVKIFDSKNRLFRYWKLDKHGEGVVFDECKNAKATVTNGIWEINNHAEWKKRTTITIPGYTPQIAFDRLQKRIFVVKKNIVSIYDAKKNSIDTLIAKQGMPFYLRINQLLYDQVNDRLVMYDFTRNQLARFDFKTQIWTNEQDTFSLPHFMHHSKYYDEKNKMIYTFGGYGFHQFSALLQQYSESSQQWESFDLSGDINPRYLGAMGMLNDSLLLYFGGHGNISGKQYEAPHNYYDLYTINIRTRNVRKIWELSDVANHFTNSNSLVVNNTSQTFYTLSHPNNVYETQLLLHEYKLNAPEFRTLGNPIPFLFNDVDAYCNLFIPADSTELFAVVSYATGKKSIIDIYSIAYPPLGIEGISQTESKINPALYLLFYVALFIIIALLIYFITKRVRKTMHIRSVLKTIDLKTNEAKDHLGKAIDDEADKPPFPAINVLNVFEVLDSKGTTITNLFSPAISRIFLLLYFKTLENGKGVTSSELGRILWPDKDYESIRNNKNVYFHKLRPILSMIGNIQLTQTNDFWALLYDNETIYSDYEQVMKNIAILRKKPELDKELLNEVLKIAKKGDLLSFDEFEWLDAYKANYANTIIEFLSELTGHPDVKNDYPLLFDIAKVILIQDNIEEFGIKLKCSILYKLGKKKQALLCYNKYVEEYVTVLNTKPELTFDKII